jgi:SAM-dependent methyltransferase
VIAVEPDDAMRAVLEDVVPAAECHAGSGESIPVPDDCVDAVFSAEAFHWFANDEAVAEIARVLRPGGGFAFFWNVDFGEAEPPMGQEAHDLVEDAFERGGTPGLPRVLSGEWRAPLERSAFGPVGEAEVERSVVRDREQWIAMIMSVSSVASQSEDYRRELAENLRAAVPEGRYRWPTRTVAYWTRLG